jgi:hypothetical protein
MIKEQAMTIFREKVLPYASDPRENFKATAALNFWGIIEDLSYSDDIEDQILKSELLTMPIANCSKEWAMNVLCG